MCWTARTEPRQVQGECLAPVISDLRSRRSRMAGSVNIGNIGATEDAATRRFSAVATQTASDTRPLAAARLARDIDQPSRPQSEPLSCPAMDAIVTGGAGFI